MALSGDWTHVTGTVTPHFQATVPLGLADMIRRHEPALVRAAGSTCFGAERKRRWKSSQYSSPPHSITPSSLPLSFAPYSPMYLHCALGACWHVVVQQGSLTAHTAGSCDRQSHCSPSSIMPFPHEDIPPECAEQSPKYRTVKGVQQAKLTQQTCHFHSHNLHHTPNAAVRKFQIIRESPFCCPWKHDKISPSLDSWGTAVCVWIMCSTKSMS